MNVRKTIKVLMKMTMYPNSLKFQPFLHKGSSESTMRSEDLKTVLLTLMLEFNHLSQVMVQRL